MRLAAQAKGGFYPASPEALKFICSFLTVAPGEGAPVILDPCCGRGEALATIGAELKVDESCLYACELDVNRSIAARGRLPKATVLTETDYLGADVQAGAFSLAWVNPPFDDELGGGGRVEYRFATRATSSLAKGGILLLCCPSRVIEGVDLHIFLMSYFEDLQVVPFPADHRPFNEVVLFGRKRKSAVEGGKMRWDQACRWIGSADDRPWWQGAVESEPALTYEVPPLGGKPKRFAKATLAPWELAAALAASPARRVFLPPPPQPRPRPPMQLGVGQRALVLAGGFLNTVLQRTGERPIVIKATPYKVQALKGVKTEFVGQPGKEKEKTVTTLTEQIKLKVRVLTEEGAIHDLG